MGDGGWPDGERLDLSSPEGESWQMVIWTYMDGGRAALSDAGQEEVCLDLLVGES